ncbi:hypothetical protein BJ508DRAFT_11476 [Ascobolus immersus RN42]|uniref:Uncharacterized protein n=1 Tax=Ascobolus immersus RN42 TaxID=1160509 RepID=A0A3N4HUC8_ASCIM|nr:hypothetical protein BJ508DRAFT_11476 [Ascobolus immersus RN42]
MLTFLDAAEGQSDSDTEKFIMSLTPAKAGAWSAMHIFQGDKLENTGWMRILYDYENDSTENDLQINPFLQRAISLEHGIISKITGLIKELTDRYKMPGGEACSFHLTYLESNFEGQWLLVELVNQRPDVPFSELRLLLGISESTGEDSKQTSSSIGPTNTRETVWEEHCLRIRLDPKIYIENVERLFDPVEGYGRVRSESFVRTYRVGSVHASRKPPQVELDKWFWWVLLLQKSRKIYYPFLHAIESGVHQTPTSSTRLIYNRKSERDDGVPDPSRDATWRITDLRAFPITSEDMVYKNNVTTVGVLLTGK